MINGKVNFWRTRSLPLPYLLYLLAIALAVALYTHFPITLFLVVFCGITGLCLFKPDWGLSLWAGLLGIQLMTVGSLGINIAPSDLFLIPLTLVVSGQILTGKRVYKKSNLAIWIFLLLISLTLGLGVFYRSFGYLSSYTLLNKYLGLISLALAFFIVKHFVNDDEELNKLINVFFVSGSLINLLVLSLYLLSVSGRVHFLSDTIREGGRLRGFLCDPNAYAGYVSILLLFSLSFLLTGERKGPLLFSLFNTLLLTLSLFFTFSRTGWLGFLIGLGVILFLSKKIKPALLYSALPFLSFLVLMLILPHFGLRPDFFIFRKWTYYERLDLMSKGWDLYKENYLLGIGLGTFRQLFPTIIHNSFVWILVETGPLGLIALIGLFIQAISDLLRYDVGKLRVPVLSGLFAYIGLAMGIEALYQRPLWLFLALGSALSQIRLEQKEKGKDSQ